MLKISGRKGGHYSILTSTPQIQTEIEAEFNEESNYAVSDERQNSSPKINAELRQILKHKVRDIRQEVIIRKERLRIIQPSSKRKLFWDALNLVLLFYGCFEIPYFLAFMPANCMGSWFETFDTLIDLIFLIDCCITLFTAYMDEETGALVTEPSAIRKNYICGWMFFDVATSLPFDRLMCALSGAGSAVQMCRLLKLLRVVRVIRTARRIEEEAAHVLLPGAISLVHFIALLLLCAHWCACLLYGVIGSTACLIPLDAAEPRGSVVCGCDPDDACQPWNWLVRYDPALYSSNSTASHYLAAVYFSIVTLCVPALSADGCEPPHRRCRRSCIIQRHPPLIGPDIFLSQLS